jgi:hypothetical protein
MVEFEPNVEVENIEVDEAQSPRVYNALGVNMLKPKAKGYARPFYPDLPPDGSVLAAHFRRDNVIGHYFNTINPEDFNLPNLNDPDYNYTEHIPVDLYEQYGHMYALTYNKEHADALTEQLRAEVADHHLFAQHPVASTVSGLVAALADPTVFLPGGALYRGAKLSSGIMKSALSVSAAAASAQSVLEFSRHQTQYTATLDESAYNILGAGLIGGLMGGFGGAFVNGKIFTKAKTDATQGLADNAPIGATMTAEQSLSARATRDPAYEKEQNSLYGKGWGGKSALFLAWAAQKMDPIGRLFFSEFPTAQRIVNDLFDHNLITNAMKPGMRKRTLPSGEIEEFYHPGITRRESVELEIKRIEGEMYGVYKDYQDIFFEQAGVKGPFKGIQTKLSKTGLSLGEFELQTWRTIINGVTHSDGAVQRAADLINNKFFAPVRDMYIELGIFSPDIDVKTAANYFMRVYNRSKILDPAQRNIFKTKLFDHIKKNNEELAAIEPQIKALETRIADLKKSSVGTQKARRAQIKELRQALKEMVPDRLRNSKGKIRKVIHPDYYSVEADNIIDNILGFSDGSHLNPLIATLPKGKKTNPLKERKLLIPDAEIEDFLITSFLEVAPMFIKATAPHIAFNRVAQKLGFKSELEMIAYNKKTLDDDLKAAIEKNPAKREKLEKQYKKTQRDINASYDVLKGVYGAGPNTIDSSAAALMKGISSYNFVRYMGQILNQSFTDVGNIGLKHGLFRTVFNGALPVLTRMGELKNNKQLMKQLYFCCNTLNGVRLKGMIDQDMSVVQNGLFSRVLNKFTASYGNLTLLNPWTDAMEYMAGNVSIGRTLDAIVTWKNTGKMAENEKLRLNDLGIEERNYDRIYNQYKKNGGKKWGAYWIDWTKWDVDDASLDALMQFKNSLIRETEQTVISRPSAGGKPLYAHTAMGGLVFQFKGFSHAATKKLLISGLQRSDMEFFSGLMLTGTISLMAYVAHAYVRGDEVDLSYDNLFREMIDRSGITGVFGNFYNSANKLGIIPGQAVTRYRNRGVASVLGGPTLDSIDVTFDLIKKYNADVPFNTNDMYKLLRFLPAQNYILTHRLNRYLAKSFADWLDWEESPE